jgi:hypothetical protein
MGTNIKKSRKSVVAAGPGARKRAKPTSKPVPKAAVTASVKATRKPARRAPAVRQASRSERSYAIKP